MVDTLQDNRVYLPSRVCVNKTDLIEPDYKDQVDAQLREHGLDPDDCIFISAEAEKGLDALKEAIWESLGLVRIYMNKPGRGTDYEEPLILTEDANTVEDALHRLGGSFDERFKFARDTGESAKHDEQQVGRDHELVDEDVLRIVARK